MTKNNIETPKTRLYLIPRDEFEKWKKYNRVECINCGSTFSPFGYYYYGKDIPAPGENRYHKVRHICHRCGAMYAEKEVIEKTDSFLQ